jgi:Family of unknown function (DUF6095)
MSINKIVFSKGIKKLAGSLPLLFLGPAVIHNAFMNQKNNWHYLVLVLGILICFIAVYLLFKGLQTIIQSIFND